LFFDVFCLFFSSHGGRFVFFFEFLMKKNPPEVAHGGRDGLREALNLSRSCWLAQSWMGTLIPDRSL